MAWARQHRTPHDFFVAGDSGAGYLNPGLLSPPRMHSGLPSGMATWERHCRRFFTQWDITLTGFVIDGFGPGLAPEGLDAYARFSPDGIVAQKIGDQGVHGTMPYLRMLGDLPGDAADAARMLRYGSSGPLPRFGVFRSILQTPTWYAEVQQELQRSAGDEVRVVDLYTLMWLVREYESHPERYAREEFRNAREVSARPQSGQGLDVLYVDDGRFTIEKGAGDPHWLSAARARARYLYLDVAHSFPEARRTPLAIEVEYMDTGNFRFGLEYDSLDTAAPLAGAYKPHPQLIQASNSGQWRSAVFHVEDARFQGRQNGAADFRFYCLGDDVRVRRVTVRRK
jgi:hypothetical protein